jgi:hypothetical protein
MIGNFFKTHLVCELEWTPIPFLIELFMDSTGEVVIASKDIVIVLHIWKARYGSFSIIVH